MLSLLDLLFPKRCLGCGKWGRYVCSSCQHSMKLLPYLKCPVCERPAMDGMTHPGCRTRYTIDGLISFFRYDGITKKAIKKIKYRYISDMVSELIDLIPDSSFSVFQKILNFKFLPAGRQGSILNCIFVPIPLHRSRYNFRGFNQAEVIAQVLSKRLHIPVKTNVLIRTKKTIPQVEMKKRGERLQNMKDVFAMKNDSAIQRLNDPAIFLVDDVFTTGATLRSAASVLKHVGVKFVWGMTIAQ